MFENVRFLPLLSICTEAVLKFPSSIWRRHIEIGPKVIAMLRYNTVQSIPRLYILYRPKQDFFTDSNRVGCAQILWERLGLLMSGFPVIIPPLAVEDRADYSHSIHTCSAPLCSRLLQTCTDQILHATFQQVPFRRLNPDRRFRCLYFRTTNHPSSPNTPTQEHCFISFFRPNRFVVSWHGKILSRAREGEKQPLYFAYLLQSHKWFCTHPFRLRLA